MRAVGPLVPADVPLRARRRISTSEARGEDRRACSRDVRRSAVRHSQGSGLSLWPQSWTSPIGFPPGLPDGGEPPGQPVRRARLQDLVVVLMSQPEPPR
jgi:hypothetical protein